MLGYVAADFSGISALFVICALFAVLFLVIFIVLLPAIVLSAAARKKAEQLRSTYDTSVIAQYDPPHGLSPAEIGFLYDMRCDDKEIHATLLDLSRRGIVTMQPNGQVTMQQSANMQALQPYEQTAIKLHRSPTTQLPAAVPNLPLGLAGLPTGTLALYPRATKSQFTAEVQKALAVRGYRTHSYLWSFVVRVLVVAAVAGLWPLGLAALGGTNNGSSYGAWSGTAILLGLVMAFILFFFLWPVYIGFGYIVMKLWVRLAGRAWLNTRQIRTLWPELEGYRQYLQEVYFPRSQTAAPAELLSTALPYAVALGLAPNTM